MEGRADRDRDHDNYNKPVATNSANLVGYWKFDETSGTTAADAVTTSGHTAHNGTLKADDGGAKPDVRRSGGAASACLPVALQVRAASEGLRRAVQVRCVVPPGLMSINSNTVYRSTATLPRGPTNWSEW